MRLMTGFLVAMLASGVFAEGAIHLPQPGRDFPGTLSETLQKRRSSRSFRQGKQLSQEMISSLLWATFGVNRPDGRRTAPTGRNVQDIDIYIMTDAGAYLYDALKNELVEKISGDQRDLAGTQAFAKRAPVSLFIVQDTARSMDGSDIEKALYGGVHAGAAMQNALLFCAANGLACVPRLSIDKDALAKALGLASTQQIVIGISVGHPAE